LGQLSSAVPLSVPAVVVDAVRWGFISGTGVLTWFMGFAQFSRGYLWF